MTSEEERERKRNKLERSHEGKEEEEEKGQTWDGKQKHKTVSHPGAQEMV